MVEWKNSKLFISRKPKKDDGDMSSVLEEVFYYLPVYSVC